MIKRSDSEWFDLFAKHETSGVSAAQFCRDEQLCAKYFSLRKKQLNWSSTRTTAGSQVSSEFIKVSVHNPGGMSLECGRVKFSCPELPPADWLVELIKVL